MVRFTMVNLKKYFPLSIAFLIGVALTQAVTFIYAHGGDVSLIHACVKTNNGSLRIVGANDECNSNETPLDWSIQGPMGPAGSTGPMGPTGATGTGGGGGLIGVFGGYTTDQLVGMDTINEPFIYRYFVGGNFSGTQFAEHIQASNFSQSNLTNTIWWGTNILSSNFTQADYSNSTFYITDTNSNFTSANFTNVNFDSSVFTDSNFTNANFTNANLTGASFTNTTMTGIIWNNTTCPDGTNSDNNGNTCEGHLTL